jgi:hypothetical protein
MHTATLGDVFKSTERICPARQRLQWAVEFAGYDLARLPLWRVEELRKEVRLFVGLSVGISASDDQVELPTDEDLAKVQWALREMIAAVIEQRSTPVGHYPGELNLVFLPRKATGPEDVDQDRPREPHLIEDGKDEMPLPALARWTLGMSIVEQHRAGVTIKRCPGPVPRDAKAVCGKPFVGPGKKQFCSAACRTRAIDRRRRPLVHVSRD